MARARGVTPAFLNAGHTVPVMTVDRHAGPQPARNPRALTADVTDEADVRRVVAEVSRRRDVPMCPSASHNHFFTPSIKS